MLRERHEALAQTVEVTAGMQRENERLFRENNQSVREHLDQIGQNFDQVGRNFEMILDALKRLENIAMAHERRLDDIESQ
jgi:hypothetical protein